MNTRNENRGDYTINSSRKTPNTSPELSGRRLFLFQGSGRSPSCFFGRCRPGPCLMALSIVYTRSPCFLVPRTAPVVGRFSGAGVRGAGLDSPVTLRLTFYVPDWFGSLVFESWGAGPDDIFIHSFAHSLFLECSLCAGFRKHKRDDVLALARAARGDTLRSHHDTAP